MSKKYRKFSFTVVFVVLTAIIFVFAYADEFTKKDLERWQKEYMSVVETGRELWVSPDLGTNGVACAQCHPNAANTHPETYSKFQQQLGKVIALRDMINWCILNHPRLVAIEAYVTHERRGVALDPGKH
jgi:thiosulfate dehydrogenase